MILIDTLFFVVQYFCGIFIMFRINYFSVCCALKLGLLPVSTSVRRKGVSLGVPWIRIILGVGQKSSAGRQFSKVRGERVDVERILPVVRQTARVLVPRRGRTRLILADANFPVLGVGVLVAVKALGPLEAEPVHQALAAVFGRQTQRAARRDGVVEYRADGRVDAAQEELQVGTAVDFD